MRKRLTASTIALFVASPILALAAVDASSSSFVVSVAASGAPVVARVTAGGKMEQQSIAMGKKHDFTFADDVSKYTFEIIGCGKIQNKTVYVEAGHPGAKITVLAGCMLSIVAR